MVINIIYELKGRCENMCLSLRPTLSINFNEWIHKIEQYLSTLHLGQTSAERSFYKYV